jgi:GGDEF domain-containing protein
MSDVPRAHQAPRAGPVAGLPVDAVVARAEELARRWAIALVLARPLEGLGGIPLEDLAREAPALCAQTVRALESDAELDRLTGSLAGGREESAPARRLVAMSGARDSAALVRDVEALRGALWEGLLEELGRPLLEQAHARRIADVSDRLAYVCASALGAALASVGAIDELPAPPAERDPEAARREADLAPDRATPAPATTRRAVIFDERAPEPDLSRGAVRPAAEPSPAEIEIRDQRGEEGPAAWIGSIGRQLERFRRDGRPFAVLLVELRDIERLRRDASTGALTRLASQVERVLAAEQRPGGLARGAAGLEHELDQAPWAGSLTRERPGRYWLLSPETDRLGANALAERLVRAIGHLAGGSGGSLEVAIGTAVCPADGREAAELAAHADIELYASRSSARAAVGRPPA